MKRLNKGVKERVMNHVEKSNSEEYETSWEGGEPKHKKKSEIKKGKQSKSKGTRFELKVRQDLESKGKIVDKWNNNVDLEKDELVIAKRKYNPFKKMLVIGTGFPDFITIQPLDNGLHRVIGVEVKTNGLLSKEEKEKCAWYLKKKIFSEIWIAKAVKKGRKIEIKYDDFSEKYGKKYKNL